MNRPWMPLYVDDYLRDTNRLTTLEHGAYLLLIMEYWRHRGLPTDEHELARIARLSDREWKKVRVALSRLFKYEWRHKRIDAEIAKAEQISERRKASAHERWSKRNASADANASSRSDANASTRGMSRDTVHNSTHPEAEGELSRLVLNPDTGELRQQDRGLPQSAPVVLIGGRR